MIALHKLNAGDNVLVKVGKNEIHAEVLEVRPDKCLVRNMATGHEFAVAKVWNYLNAPEAPATPVEATALTEPAQAPEASQTEEPASDQPRAAEPVQAPSTDAAKPGKKMSLLEAAYNVLLQEKRPMNTREMVKAAIDKGLWIATSCKTPEQSLYGAIFLEIKKAEHPRFKKSVKRGAFEVTQ